jgi:hypothetical protein
MTKNTIINRKESVNRIIKHELCLMTESIRANNCENDMDEKI